jgi:RNA polymerase sigma factor (sigma-70 family)
MVIYFKWLKINIIFNRYQFWHALAKLMTMNTDNNLTEIWEGCLQNDRKYQEQLYKLMAAKMMAVCMRYTNDKDEAQDILQEGFVKMFHNVHNFRNEGSLEGWIRHIMVNTAISRYRKSKMTVLVDDFSDEAMAGSSSYNGNTLEEADLLHLIDQLPDSYRSVFNMHAIEGYSHQEISNSLGMSELLSRTTLNRARGMLKNKLVQLQVRERHCLAG